MPALRVKTADGWVEIKGAKGDPGLMPEEVELVAQAAVDANPTIADHETRIARNEGRVVDARAAGLVGDGTTDETAALLAAITSNPGKVLSIPQDFTIRITGEVLSSVNTKLVGHGHTSRIYVDSTTTNGLKFLGAGSVHLENLSIVGRTQKDGNKLASPELAGVWIEKVRKVVLRGVEFSYLCGYGVRGVQLEDVWAQDNYCHDNYQGQVGSDLGFYAGVRSAVITGNICTSNVTSSIEVNSVGGTIPVSGNPPGQIVIANNITDCQIGGTAITSGFIDATVGPTGFTEPMKHRRGINIAYTGGAGRVVVTGNTCLNGAWNGVYANHGAATAGGPYLIANNIIKNFGFADPGAAESGLYGGVHISVAGYPNQEAPAILADNILENGSAHAFAIKTSSEAPTIIANNLIQGCVKGIYDYSSANAAQIEGNNIRLVSDGAVAIEGIVSTLLSTNAPATGHVHIDGNIVRIDTVGTATSVHAITIDTSTISRNVRVTDNVLDLLDNSGVGASVSVRAIRVRQNQPTEVSRNHLKGFKEGVYFDTSWSSTSDVRGMVRVWANRLEHLTTGIVLRGQGSNFAAIVPIWHNTFADVTNRTGADGWFNTALEVESYDEASGSVTFRSATVPTTATGYQAGDRCISTTLTSGTPMGWTYDGTSWKAWANYA